jgi:hypothetical protein
LWTRKEGEFGIAGTKEGNGEEYASYGTRD